MSRLVLSALVSSLLILNLVQSSPLDDWDHPITYKERKLALRNERADANYRLSGDVFPKNYDIWIRSQLHEQSLAFSGEVKITIQAARSTSSITLHALQMKVLEADLKDLTTDETFMLYFELDTVTDLLTFRSGHVEQLNLIPGREYLLIIKYEGNLRRDNGGFYLSTYVNSNNQQVNIATTQFQATDARHAFPCFDEPGFKATYDIAITHGSNYNALSNMPILRIENTSPSTKTTYFQTTPLMSTYLVAFIISGFESTQGQQGNVLHRVFSTPETKNMQQYALTTSQKALNYLADYLSVPYGLPKLDNVAIPDFGAGAMENWGLVTYREEFLLFDRAKSSVNTELNIAITVAHELAHQWFGNLVTPKWWQHLWLNEGFATLYEYLTVNAIYPEHNIMQNFAVSHYLRALLNDGQKNPRAMSTDVDTPTEISNLFDSVSYSKSGCVLRMFQHVLGPAKFQMALSSYLKENSYKVVDEDDLFKHLSTAAGGGIAGLPANSLESFFKSWTNQGGYPILTVTRNYSSGSFQISQEFFDNTNKPTSNALWVVPYNYVYGNNPNFTSTSPDGFLNKVPSVTVDSMSSSNTANEWLLLNKHVTGYYRVNYDAKNWDLLAKQLHKDHTKIHVMNRVQLVDDPIRLAFAGRLDPATALNLLAYIENEEQYAPWAAANNVFNALSTYFLGDANFDVLEYYVRQLVTPIYKKLGAKEGGNDTVHHKLTRNIAINWACRAKVTECIEQTYKRLEEVITKQIEVEPSLKSAIFCNALLKGGEAEFRYIFQRILTSTDQAERRQLMPALGCSRNETLLMEFAMTSTAYSSELNYRIQERINVLSAIIDKNKVGLQTAMKFLKENHGAYYSLGSAGFMDTNPLVSILSSISSRVYSKELVDEFNALLVEVRTGVLGNSTLLTNMKSRAESNLLWVTENREKYVNWLSTFKNSATSSILSTVTLVFTLFVSLRSYF